MDCRLSTKVWWLIDSSEPEHFHLGVAGKRADSRMMRSRFGYWLRRSSARVRWVSADDNQSGVFFRSGCVHKSIRNPHTVVCNCKQPFRSRLSVYHAARMHDYCPILSADMRRRYSVYEGCSWGNKLTWHQL